MTGGRGKLHHRLVLSSCSEQRDAEQLSRRSITCVHVEDVAAAARSPMRSATCLSEAPSVRDWA